MLLGLMSPVVFNKWPCRRVDFRGLDPSYGLGQKWGPRWVYLLSEPIGCFIYSQQPRSSYKTVVNVYIENIYILENTPWQKLPGGRLDCNYARMCVSKIEGYGSLFSFKWMKWMRRSHSKWVWNLLFQSIWVGFSEILYEARGKHLKTELQMIWRWTKLMWDQE